jgi:hypothetical protein
MERFDLKARPGWIFVDWPIRYRDIAPWYSYVEKFAAFREQVRIDTCPTVNFFLLLIYPA